LIKYYGVRAVPENTGRQVTYRLFAPNHFEPASISSLLLSRNEAAASSPIGLPAGSQAANVSTNPRNSELAVSGLTSTEIDSESADVEPSTKKTKAEAPHQDFALPQWVSSCILLLVVCLLLLLLLFLVLFSQHSQVSHPRKRPLTIQHMRRKQWIIDTVEKERVLVKEHLRRRISSTTWQGLYTCLLTPSF